MYVYKDHGYDSQVHDYGDDYHSDIGTCFIEDDDINNFIKYLKIKKDD